MIPFQAMKPFFKGRIPGQLIIQFSNQCNAACPQCGMRRSAAIDRNTLHTDQTKRLIDSAAENGFQALSLTGGEPLLHLDMLLELINYARQAGISHVRTGTNGYIFQGSDKPDFEKRIHRIAEGFSKSGLSSFWISLDSANPEDHETMRGLQGLIKGIEKGLPIFHAHNIYPSANLGINRNTGGKNPLLYQKNLESEVFFELFKEAFRKFYTFTLDLGFTTASACYPMSHEEEGTETEHAQGKSSQDISTYGATSTDRVIHFSPREKGLIFQALYETIPEFRSRLRILHPSAPSTTWFDNTETVWSHSIPVMEELISFLLNADRERFIPAVICLKVSLSFRIYRKDLIQKVIVTNVNGNVFETPLTSWDHLPNFSHHPLNCLVSS